MPRTETVTQAPDTKLLVLAHKVNPYHPPDLLQAGVITSDARRFAKPDKHTIQTLDMLYIGITSE